MKNEEHVYICLFTVLFLGEDLFTDTQGDVEDRFYPDSQD
jgi:hypothetical protein